MCPMYEMLNVTHCKLICGSPPESFGRSASALRASCHDCITETLCVKVQALELPVCAAMLSMRPGHRRDARANWFPGWQLAPLAA